MLLLVGGAQTLSLTCGAQSKDARVRRSDAQEECERRVALTAFPRNPGTGEFTPQAAAKLAERERPLYFSLINSCYEEWEGCSRAAL